MLEIVDHGLSVEIVHRDRQKVPKQVISSWESLCIKKGSLNWGQSVQ